MKKKLLTSAAIASFLTAAGVMIPQADIFAADTPSEQPGTVEHDRNYNTGKDILEAQNKKQVQNFVDYWIDSVTRDKNLLTIKTKNNVKISNLHYTDESEHPSQFDDTPKAQALYPLENSTANTYYFDTNEIVKGENSHRKYVLDEIFLLTTKEDMKNKYFITNRYDKNGEKLENHSLATNGGIYLDSKDLSKYYNLTRVVGANAKEVKQESPDFGDKDFVAYVDKKNVNQGETIRITVKYKQGTKKYTDDMYRKFLGNLSDGTQVFENNYYYTSDVLKYENKNDLTDSGNETTTSFMTINNEGDDLYYLNVGKSAPGYYHLSKLFGLDLAKGNVVNADFTINGLPKNNKDETSKPSSEPQPGKEETLKPGETPQPGKEETLKPGETPQPGKEETLKPGETPKLGKEETLKPGETAKSEKDSDWNPFAQGQKAKEGSTEVKSEGGEAATKPVSNRKAGKALPNTGLQTTSYGFLAAIVGLFGAVALRRKNR